jgi:hypothetical protein
MEYLVVIERGRRASGHTCQTCPGAWPLASLKLKDRLLVALKRWPEDPRDSRPQYAVLDPLGEIDEENPGSVFFPLSDNEEHLSRRHRKPLIAAAEDVFTSQSSGPTISQALTLARLLDADVLDPFLRDLAAGRLERYAAMDPEDAVTIQAQAMEILESRVVIK